LPTPTLRDAQAPGEDVSHAEPEAKRCFRAIVRPEILTTHNIQSPQRRA